MKQNKLYTFRILPSDAMCHYIILPPETPDGKLVQFCKAEYDFITGVANDWLKVQDILKKAYENG